MENKISSFEELNGINVNDYTEKKSVGYGDKKTSLTYLSWTYAWAEIKKRYPNATYEVKKFENNLPYVYDKATGYMVFTSMTIEGITHEMWLPVMDGANRAMKSEPYTIFNKEVATATMFDINKTIMRCLVKNIAMFGLGLYIFAGEDLPEEEQDLKEAEKKAPSVNTAEHFNSVMSLIDALTFENMEASKAKIRQLYTIIGNKDLQAEITKALKLKEKELGV